MAGGEGKRMRSSLPKVLHLFRGKPMLVWVIEAALSLSSSIVIVTGKFHEQIIRVLSENIDIFGIVFVRQLEPNGTGDAIKSCLGQYTMTNQVLILNGDMPLITRALLETFINNAKTDCAVLSTRLEDPHGYGRILVSGDIFEGIVEEKDATDEQRKIDQVNTGIYLITGEVLHSYIPKIKNENLQKEYYLTDIIGLIRADSTGPRVSTVFIEENENLRGINTPEELAELN